MNYYSKRQRVVQLCSGRRVLHIGCVGFVGLETSERVALAKKSLHQALTNCAQTTGVDYSQDAIDYCRDHGIFNNVIYGNAESLHELGLHPEYDVIVAGDIIEHLSNPGRMMDGIRALCHPGTRVIITTPHAFGLLTFLHHLAYRFVEGPEHVFTMNRQNVEHLAVRHGFHVVELATCYQEAATNTRMFRLGRAFFDRFPHLGGTLFAVLSPANPRT